MRWDPGEGHVEGTVACAGGSKVDIPSSGMLLAGFPLINGPEKTVPVCVVEYRFNSLWEDVIFDVDSRCLTGLNSDSERE